MATRISTGIPEIDRKLEKLARSDANKIARAGINGGLTVLTSAIRSAITTSDASPSMKRALKRTIGRRFVTSGRKATKYGASAKAGLGAGSGRKKGTHGTKDRHKRRGVGLSGNNVHWAALGTKQRWTGSRTNRGSTRLTGHKRRYTGSMPSIDVVREAGKNGISSVRRVIEERARQKIEELVK